jgi:hypothetical protein
VLRRTVRNYLALTALAVAGGLMATQAKSHVRSCQDAVVDIALARTSQEALTASWRTTASRSARGRAILARADREASAAMRRVMEQAKG